LHLSKMTQLIQGLSQSDPVFLKTNHAIDVDYFELEALPEQPWAARKAT